MKHQHDRRPTDQPHTHPDPTYRGDQAARQVERALKELRRIQAVGE